MTKEQLRNAAILVYMVGNALTFNHLLGASRDVIQETGSMAYPLVKSLVLSTIWPLYWIYVAIVG